MTHAQTKFRTLDVFGKLWPLSPKIVVCTDSTKEERNGQHPCQPAATGETERRSTQSTELEEFAFQESTMTGKVSYPSDPSIPV
jgi:hypothetical protein